MDGASKMGVLFVNTADLQKIFEKILSFFDFLPISYWQFPDTDRIM